MSGISIGQALGIIGNVPILQNVKGHTADGLKIARHLSVGGSSIGGSAGGIQSILSGVLASGPGALLQSPLGGQLSSLTGAITSAVGSLGQGAAGANSSGTAATDPATPTSANQPVITALGALSTSATNLSALADNLVGFTSNPALPGQIDVAGHLGAVQTIGPSVPEALSLATVLQSVQSANLLSGAATGVASIAAQLAAGTMAVTDAVAAVQGIQAELDAVTSASTGAIATMQAAQPALCAAQCSIALMAAGPPEMLAALAVAIRPDQMAAVQAIVAAHTAALAVAASTQSAATAAAASVAAAIAADLAQAPSN